MKFTYRGTEINKIDINSIESLLENKGININEAYSLMGDGQSDFIYVSNGFLRGLNDLDTQPKEWHHYFKKNNDDSFEAFKLNFDN